jgi:hypothetical protein
MRVRIGDILSSPRQIKGGSPQGTLLGNLLFILTTDVIDQAEDYENILHSSGSSQGDSNGSNSSAEVTFQNIGNVDLGSEESGDLTIDATIEDRQVDDEIAVNKFVDDFLAIERILKTDGFDIYEEQSPTRMLHASGSQEMFNSLKRRAKEVGLTINEEKTQLLCISDSRGYETRSFIELGNRMTSGEEMKILGFYFHSRPDAAAHVSHLKEKYRKRAWIIRHLKKAGVPSSDLVSIYFSMVRSVLEYASGAFHTLLSQEETRELERLQRMSLKTIFGHHLSYEEILKQNGIQTLEERRSQALDKLAIKLSNNGRFKDWLPEQEFQHYNLRKELVYKEKYARTDRLYRSPLYAIRRRLNTITGTKTVEYAATASTAENENSNQKT